MTSLELVMRILAADPSMAREISVGPEGADVWYVDVVPAYHDGALRSVLRDPSGAVVGGAVKTTGDKLVIKTLTLEDALSERPDLPVSVDSRSAAEALARTRYRSCAAADEECVQR